MDELIACCGLDCVLKSCFITPKTTQLIQNIVPKLFFRKKTITL